MIYVVLSPKVYNMLCDKKSILLNKRTRLMDKDSIYFSEIGFTGQCTLPTVCNGFIKLIDKTVELELDIYNIKDCERARKLISKKYNKDFEIINCSEELPMREFAAVWCDNELRTGYGHHNLIQAYGFQDAKNSLIFGEYYNKSIITVDMSDKPVLQYVILDRPLFLVVYSQNDLIYDRCKSTLNNKGVDVEYCNNYRKNDKLLNMKDFEVMLQIVREIYSKYKGEK